MERTSLYRHFDKDGRLLYVGISRSFMGRLGQHKRKSHWYWSIARVDVTHYPDRATAVRAEARAIRTEGPLHNRMVPPARKIRNAPKHLLIPFIGPSPRRVFGYACGAGEALDGMRAALGARGVPSGLMFADDLDETRGNRPGFVRLMKFARHHGSLIVAANGADFDDTARSVLVDRGVELQQAIPAG